MTLSEGWYGGDRKPPHRAAPFRKYSTKTSPGVSYAYMGDFCFLVADVERERPAVDESVFAGGDDAGAGIFLAAQPGSPDQPAGGSIREHHARRGVVCHD